MSITEWLRRRRAPDDDPVVQEAQTKLQEARQRFMEAKTQLYAADDDEKDAIRQRLARIEIEVAVLRREHEDE